MECKTKENITRDKELHFITEKKRYLHIFLIVKENGATGMLITVNV